MALSAQKMLASTGRVSAAKPAVRSLMHLQPARRAVCAKAIDDTNIFVNIIASAACVTIPAAVTIATSANRDAEIERVQTLEGAVPFIAAAAVDAIAHSIPGLNLLLGFVAEPVGAASGVAYMMSLLLAAAAIDPSTMAPKGTVLNVETAKDASASVRVPFTQIIPTTLKVIDWSNEGSSGKAWTVEDGIPKLPVNSVIAVIGVGTLILEAASHALVLSVFMPRVLTCAAWLAAVGLLLDQRSISTK